MIRVRTRSFASFTSELYSSSTAIPKTDSPTQSQDFLPFDHNKNPISHFKPSSSSPISLQKLIDNYKKKKNLQSPLEIPHFFSRNTSDNNQIHPPFSDSESYDNLVRQYGESCKVADAKRLHLQMVKDGHGADMFLCNTLINGYVKGGDLGSAQYLFDELPEMNAVTWTILISGYTKQNMPEEACYLFRMMIREGYSPSQYTLGSALRACQDSGPTWLKFALQIHGLVSKTWHAFDVVVCNALMTMYGSCCMDSTLYTRRVFDEMVIKSLISWNSIISVYCQRGDVYSAFELYSGMQKEGSGFCFRPNEYTFGSLITVTYSSSGNSGLGLLQYIFNQVMKLGYLSDLYVGSALVSGFARFGLIDPAKMVFEQMGQKNAVSVNGLMVGLVKQKRGEEAVEVFRETRDLIGMNYDSYVVLLSACSEFGSSKKGKNKGREVHALVLKKGLNDVKVGIGNGLINMYAKCASIGDASKVFKGMNVKDVISWNSIISGLDQNECFNEALVSFCSMRRSGLVPSKFTLISTLSSCASLSCINLGSQLHSEATKFGLDLDVSVSNSLLMLFAESGCLADCQKVFNLIPEYDLISWNSIIGALSNSNATIYEAIEYFLNMMRDGWTPNRVTFLNLLAAVSSLSILELGRQVHVLVLKYCLADDRAIENVLLSFYGKCGEMDDCEKIFSEMGERRDEVSWNSLITGYIHNGLFPKAMDLVWFMMQKGQKLDCFTFSTVLSACASVAALERGMEIHAHGIRECMESDVVVESALVDMYSKCGRIDYALKVFQFMPLKNEFSWNSMISGYARNGYGAKALDLFAEMLRNGQPPDHVTFVGVLSACSHVGLVNQGIQHFESMSKKYGLAPRMEHFSCMVDLLGRAGELDKIEDFIRKMPVEPNILMWRTILGACCRANGTKTDLGRKAAEMLLELEPQNAVNYVLLANLYASGGRWEDVARARTALREAAVSKEAGRSWVTMRDGIHVFVAGDRSHPETEEIYAKLRELNHKMRDAGYVPMTKYALYDVDMENKEELLRSHSEKLAVAFVLIRTSGLPIRILKNLRVCGDCHSAFEYISKIVGRHIVLRDSNRFHHFVDGKCSCGGFW